MSVSAERQLEPPVSRLADGDAQRWSSFVRDSVNGTLFHHLEFLDYHPPDRFSWHHLVIGNPGTPIALLAAAEQQDESGRRVLRSPAGATFGGLVLRNGLGLEHTVSLLRALIQYASCEGFSTIILGTVPRIYWRAADDTLEFALRQAGFQPTIQLSHFVDLTNVPWPDLIASVPGRRRRRVRKALQQGMQFGQAVKPSEISEFYEVLTANKQRHGAAVVHTLDEMLHLSGKFADAIRIYVARKDGRVAAGVYSVLANERVCYTQYIADDPSQRDLEATRFVIFHVLQQLHREAVSFLDLGPSAMLPLEKTSLASFKESLGAIGCNRTEWQLRLKANRK